MAPTKAKTGSSKGPNQRTTKPSSSSSSSKSKKTLKGTRPATSSKKAPKYGHVRPIKKRRTYTDEELGIPRLNMITPAGVQKPKGKKKGKVFVDDQESMMTIMAMVNAEKEEQIESKMIRARQMEEVREARRKEQEAKAEMRKGKLEETKAQLRKKEKTVAPRDMDSERKMKTPGSANIPKKRVSFG